MKHLKLNLALALIASTLLTGCSNNEKINKELDKVTEVVDIIDNIDSKDNKVDKLDIIGAAVDISEATSDKIDSIQIENYVKDYENNLTKVYDYTYVINADKLILESFNKDVKIQGQDRVEISLDYWKAGDFANQLIEFNKYMAVEGNHEVIFDIGTLNSENIKTALSDDVSYTLTIPSISLGTEVRQDVLTFDFYNYTMITVEFDSSFYGRNVIPLLYTEDEDVYIAPGYDGFDDCFAIMLPPLYYTMYNDGNINDIYEVLPKRSAVEVKLNGEVVDYLGNSQYLFNMADMDKNDIASWDGVGRYAVHPDGTSCQRLAFIYKVYDLENDIDREVEPFVEWIGVQVNDISACDGCTNKIELGGMEITEVEPNDIIAYLKEAGVYLMDTDKSRKTLRLTIETLDESRYEQLMKYFIDYDKVCETNLFEEVIVNREFRYQ